MRMQIEHAFKGCAGSATVAPRSLRKPQCEQISLVERRETRCASKRTDGVRPVLQRPWAAPSGRLLVEQPDGVVGAREVGFREHAVSEPIRQGALDRDRLVE